MNCHLCFPEFDDKLVFNEKELYDAILNCRRCPNVEPRSFFTKGEDGRVLFVGIQPSWKGHPLNPNPRKDIQDKFDDFWKLKEEYGLGAFRFTNFVKCATDAAGMPPSKQEFENCFPYLKDEIELFGTRYLVFVGRRFRRKGIRDRLGVNSNWCYHYSARNSNKPWYLPAQKEQFGIIMKEISDLGIA